MLTGRFDEQTTFAESDLCGRILSADHVRAMVAKLQQIKVVPATVGCSLADIAMRFCISTPHVAVTYQACAQ